MVNATILNHGKRIRNDHVQHVEFTDQQLSTVSNVSILFKILDKGLITLKHKTCKFQISKSFQYLS